MQCHNLTYQIHVHGEDLQFVMIGLSAWQTVVAEAGPLMFMNSSVKMGTGRDVVRKFQLVTGVGKKLFLKTA